MRAMCCGCLAAGEDRHSVIAGSQAAALGNGSATTLDILPDARGFMLLPQTLLTSDLAPLYGRPPDARLPGLPA